MRNKRCALLLLGFLTLAANVSQANVYYVNSAADDPTATAGQMDGKITLREAVMAASTNLPFGDAAAGSSNSYDNIYLQPSGKGSVVRIRLQQELVIRGWTRIDDHRLSLVGNRVEISGEGRCRIFNVTPKSILLLENVNLINGLANIGGAVHVRSAHFDAKNVEFQNNEATDGGAVIFRKSSGLLKACSFIDNIATNGGGAILADLGEFIHMDNCTLTGNFASNEGGAILIRRGYAAIPTTMKATNCTIVDNAVGSSGEGGGVMATDFTTAVDMIFLFNCIVAGNTRDFSTPNDVATIPFYASNNLVGFADPSTNIEDGDPQNNQVGTLQQPLDPDLGNFGRYRGRTRGFRPRAGSPALNAGDNEFVDGTGQFIWVVAEDQRGFNRIRNGTVDIGSIER